MEDEEDFRWDTSVTLDILARGSVLARIVTLLRGLFRRFSVVSSGIEKVSR